MPGTNLTRDEAAARSQVLAIDEYDVALELAGDGPTFPSTTVLRFSCTEPGVSSFVDLIAPAVREVTLNGRSLDVADVVADNRIRLDGLADANELRVVADCAYMRTGEGLHRFVDPADSRTYLYTQFEVPDARRVFASFEQPDLKATFTLHVTAPASWEVVSNSPTPEPTPVGGTGAAGDALARWNFAPTERISTYLVAVVAGPYAKVTDSWTGTYGTVPMALYCRPSIAEHLDAEDLFTVTKQGLAFYEEQFACAYPFGKYDQLFVPEFNAGAMENAGAVTIRDEYVFRSRQTASAYEGRANTVLHELAHMWFGDLVTMRWWDDLWLNESFAEWASHWSSVAATRYTGAWVNFAGRKNWAYRADQLPSTHPVAADMTDLETVEANFDGITYAKGASALRQLVAWVGEKEFVDGLRGYFAEHAFGNATFADLLRALEDSSGRELGDWARLWLRTTGVNTLRAESTVDANDRYTSFTVVQSAAPEHPTLRPHRMAVGTFDLGPQGLVRRGRVELDVTGERTDVPAMLGEGAADLVLLNDDDLTYAKVRMDERSLATLVSSVGTLAEPLARSLCWTSAWDMTRDAEFRASEYVDLVLRGLPAETEIAAVQVLCGQAGVAVEQYVAPEHRSQVRGRWTTGLRALLAQALPGSDLQLQLVRSVAASASTAQDLDLLAGLLDGSAPLPGLAVDIDLRWALVTGLARRGRADDALIAAELATDGTISGEEHAAAASAVRPERTAKERAWADVLSEDVANGIKSAVGRSFWQGGQQEVLADYVDRYFTEAATIWGRMTPTMATGFLAHLFPRTADPRIVLDGADRFLAGSGATGAVRRYVGEGRADAARAAAAQEFDRRVSR